MCSEILLHVERCREVDGRVDRDVVALDLSGTLEEVLGRVGYVAERVRALWNEAIRSSRVA